MITHNKNYRVLLATIVLTIVLQLTPATKTNAILVFDGAAFAQFAQTLVKDFTLDGLAYRIAHIALQQITADTVNWINTGFKGSPAFLTNPNGFFLDVADQATGVMVSNNGALSKLCSPINIDIRLAISIGQVNARNPHRYDCTLSTVIGNVRGASVNGKSIEGFMKGDFSQGGLPAFISLTTEPQNNMFGAYLQAHSDLLESIGATQGGIDKQLYMGRGFLSKRTCTDVLSTEQNVALNEAAGEGDLSAEKDLYYSAQTVAATEGSDITSTVDENGNVAYQSCKTVTPGSVIAGSLDKALSYGGESLNLADSINEIVDALFGQLVTKVLRGGLSGASVTGGAASQLSQASYGDKFEIERARMSSVVQNHYEPLQRYAALRQEAYDTIEAARTSYQTARACFQNALANGFTQIPATSARGGATTIQGEIAAIDGDITTKISTLEQIYGPKLEEANRRLASMNETLNAINLAVDIDSQEKAQRKVTEIVQIPLDQIDGDIAAATTDKNIVATAVQPLSQSAQQYQNICSSIK